MIQMWRLRRFVSVSCSSISIHNSNIDTAVRSGSLFVVCWPGVALLFGDMNKIIRNTKMRKKCLSVKSYGHSFKGGNVRF